MSLSEHIKRNTVKECNKQPQDWSDTGGGGLRYLEMLFRCNYLAMVGGGQNPRCGQYLSLDFARYGTNSKPEIWRFF